ncbi:MAG: ATP-binding protein [Candidatus Aminicenantes bacterium]|nr:ATP-binding protein [Candidatus Aminicenantes bacterium]
MKRTIGKAFLEWKQDPKRKILLLRGARQVGKTYSIRELGKTFSSFVEVNFEENPEIKPFFEKSLNPLEIIEKLAIYFGKAIVPGESLLFFDEIQACPEALKSLRFFYEKIPELHVAAAGSLLELAIADLPSFGVGRIESLFMYPLTFAEFMAAAGDQQLNSLIAKASPENPLDNIIHEKILAKLKIFQIIGGMPEVVKDYLETKDFNRCQKKLDNLVTSWVDDFAKYKKRSPVLRLQEVFKAIVFQTGNKFKYSSIANGRTELYKDALELLIKAGLAYKVCHTSARGLPLGAQINEKKFKVLIVDSGIFQRILGLNLSEYIASDLQQLINKGHLAELFAGLELIKSASPYSYPELYYWHREQRSSNAEVDFVIQGKKGVVPLEVKSGTKGQMQSLYIFLKERNLSKGVRISAEKFSHHGKITTIPLYAASRAYGI